MKAFIFAAGLGTRLKEHTADKPKALVTLSGKPLLQHVVEKMAGSNITDITVNVHHFADQIIQFLKKEEFQELNIKISDEREQLLDTGGGLKKAESLLSGSEPILIYNVDVISNLNLIDLLLYHQQSNSLATLVVRKRRSDRYLLFNDQMLLSGWRNIRTGETKISCPETFSISDEFAFSGIQIVEPKLFDLIVENGKFSIIELYLRLAKEHSIKGFVDQSTFWMDLGKPDQLAMAEKLYSKT